MTFKVTIDSSKAMAALTRLIARGQDMGPPLKAIGESLLASTKQRFVSGTAPDGSLWAPNSRATIEAFLSRRKGSFGSRGISKKGQQAAIGKRPLIGASKQLSTKIVYRVNGNTLQVGSPMTYSAMQQFGGSKSRHPNLWGDIPARPFLGISQADESSIITIVNNHLKIL